MTKKSISSMKTQNRAFCNVLFDFANQLDFIALNMRVSVEPFKNFDLPVFLCKCQRFAEETGMIRVKNIRYTRDNRHILGFDLTFNLDDADVAIRVSCYRGVFKGQLFLGGNFSTTFQCPNEGYFGIISELYERAKNVRVAA